MDRQLLLKLIFLGIEVVVLLVFIFALLVSYLKGKEKDMIFYGVMSILMSVWLSELY